ncbi:hypothetical protein DL769_000590 [Monosporascus sp. CRB-8-3]|nr:hypothetical protein DL769_000590 [Monosporascus sp. CRB-8-3]
MLFSFLSAVTLSLSLALGRSLTERQAYYVDPDTTEYCTWFYDNDGSQECKAVIDMWGIALDDFRRWSYCVEAYGEPPVEEPTTGPTPTTTGPTQPPPTTTPPGNGIKTPLPIQPDMVGNCNKFDFVKRGENCEIIAKRHGIAVAKFREWNPSVGADCTGIIGFTPTTTVPPTSTKPTNGVNTPTPTQEGMTGNCNKFYLVKKNDGCAGIASNNNIRLTDFIAWNPAVGSDCRALWADTYACVGVIGDPTAAPTTTKDGNGIATPTPTQPGMVGNCNKFHKTKKGETCSSIVQNNGISMAQFLKWNHAVGADCSSMWADTYVCVSIVGHEPIPTKTKGNGITTPSPIQTGMVTNCQTFYFVKKGDTCASIAKAKGITVANFQKWNPAVGPNCASLWTDTYACVAVL